METPPLKDTFFALLSGLLFLVIICSIIGDAHKKSPRLSACLTAEEKTDLEYFFRSLIFENYGAFVLFGSKPLCNMHLKDTDSTAAEDILQQWLDSLPDDKQAEFETWSKNKKRELSKSERHLYRGWLAWEKVQKTFEMKHYLLRIAPLPGPASYELVLVNIQQTALTLAENYAIFKNAAEMDFHPLQVVFELRNPDSIFWRKVLSMPNHLSKGLLFGFGLRNSIFGDWRFSCRKAKASIDWGKDIVEYLKKAAPVAPANSIKLGEGFIPLFGGGHRDDLAQKCARASSELGKDILDYLTNTPTSQSTSVVKPGEGSPSNFTIPLFGAIDGDDTIQKYTKEKMEIEKIYRGQDLVEVTLQRLAS